MIGLADGRSDVSNVLRHVSSPMIRRKLGGDGELMDSGAVGLNMMIDWFVLLYQYAAALWLPIV